MYQEEQDIHLYLQRKGYTSGTFKAQDVANTLCAYATMGREPGEDLMREMEGWTEAVAGHVQGAERHR